MVVCEAINNIGVEEDYGWVHSCNMLIHVTKFKESKIMRGWRRWFYCLSLENLNLHFWGCCRCSHCCFGFRMMRGWWRWSYCFCAWNINLRWVSTLALCSTKKERTLAMDLDLWKKKVTNLLICLLINYHIYRLNMTTLVRPVGVLVKIKYLISYFLSMKEEMFKSKMNTF